jgi:hypothetical protein
MRATRTWEVIMTEQQTADPIRSDNDFTKEDFVKLHTRREMT